MMQSKEKKTYLYRGTTSMQLENSVLPWNTKSVLMVGQQICFLHMNLHSYFMITNFHTQIYFVNDGFAFLRT
jgi:hypothetical protein